MRYLFLFLAIICFFAHSKFAWVIDGQIAIAAADQVKTGGSYAEARATMALWETMRFALIISGLIFSSLFAFTFLPKKKIKQPDEE